MNRILWLIIIAAAFYVAARWICENAPPDADWDRYERRAALWRPGRRTAPDLLYGLRTRAGRLRLPGEGGAECLR